MTEDLGSLDTLVNTVALLRSPQGCPWDREQSHASIKRNLLEECYEVLEAIDDGDPEELAGELGDVLIQVVFHAQIATEEGRFTLRDVIQWINEKIRQRHPHVFGDVQVADAAEVKVNWDRIKQRERGDASILEGVARELPALAHSQVVQDRASRAGFDWDGVAGVMEKVREELGELERAGSPQAREGELGDVLLAVVNLGRWLGLQVEEALRRANRRFTRRFQHMEELCRQRGLNFLQLSSEQKETLWQEAKVALRES